MILYYHTSKTMTLSLGGGVVSFPIRFLNLQNLRGYYTNLIDITPSLKIVVLLNKFYPLI